MCAATASCGVARGSNTMTATHSNNKTFIPVGVWCAGVANMQLQYAYIKYEIWKMSVNLLAWTLFNLFSM